MDLARSLYRRLRPAPPPIDKLDYEATHRQLLKDLRKIHGEERAMHLAVGGEFEAMGQLQLQTLKLFGLRPDSYLVDVGCGCGRLALPFSRFAPQGRYLGIDVVPDLVAHARKIAGRPGWRFEVAEGLRIPETDEAVDFVCFFSVFTHLLYEQSYVYLQECMRVLKPGGKVVFSFLDFALPIHWWVHEANVANVNQRDQPLNMFMSRELIQAFADHLGFTVEAIHDGDVKFIPLEEPIRFEDGRVKEGRLGLGQSACVLRK